MDGERSEKLLWREGATRKHAAQRGLVLDKKQLGWEVHIYTLVGLHFLCYDVWIDKNKKTKEYGRARANWAGISA